MPKAMVEKCSSKRKFSSLVWLLISHIVQSQAAKEQKRKRPLVQNSAAILLWDESFWRFCELSLAGFNLSTAALRGRVTNM
jgi:hypothetical protein